MVSSNFSFLTGEWAAFLDNAQKTEAFALTDPTTSAIYARRSLEQWLRWLYAHETSLDVPDKETPSLGDLLFEPTFKAVAGPLWPGLNLIRKVGNVAAHEGTVTTEQATAGAKSVFGLALFVARTYGENPPEHRTFDEGLLHKAATLSAVLPAYTSAETISKPLVASEEQVAKVQQQKDANPPVYKTAPLSEADTRRLYIDVLLQEAGWNPDAPNVKEFILKNTGERADYVLWGADGKPLAVVEAKRTTRDAREGQQQARLYADALEQLYGQRPILFYTNGYETWLWDDRRYPPRPVMGFYTADELERLIHRRTAPAISRQAVNTSIAGRPYQQLVIRRVFEDFDQQRRRALLVMATGTGKTRVSAAIVDALSKAGWAKRVLFLADRNALLTQAKRDYGKYVPNLTTVDLTKEADIGAARVVFSTYATIQNRIDSAWKNGARFYSPGHFDLVIIDEAHRSVYDKYGLLFDYFNTLLLGLTATPKADTDRDTYSLFERPQHDPTAAYELDEAVAAGWLTPPRAYPLPLKFPQLGVRYADLSEEEKEEYERKFYDPETGNVPDQIEPSAINEWLFNASTVDLVLDYLMQYGLRVEGGDKLGKTIIFARNHKHALYIEDRFNALYPHHRGGFLELIDNYSKDPEEQIDRFKIAGQFPQIAVSVDMLDTGIDVPEIVNLVFFKPVYSAAKFWQMIGRGTRLCENLFGVGDNKREFYIFDVCGNFEFFNQKPEGVKATRSASLSERLFNLRCELAYLLPRRGTTQEQENFASLLDKLHSQVAALNADRMAVRQVLPHVERFGQRTNWNFLETDELALLRQHIANLVVEPGPAHRDGDESAKQFDVLTTNLQVALLQKHPSQARHIKSVQELARQLTKQGHLPAVAPHLPLIRAVQQADYWTTADTVAVETLRQDLRGLITFIDAASRKTVFTNFQDELVGPVDALESIGRYGNLENHHERVATLVRQHADDFVIRKLRRNVAITAAELNRLNDILFAESGLETREAFEKAVGENPLGVFVRQILGLEANAAQEAFAEFLSNGPLSANQMQFIQTIISRFVKHGIVDRSMLFEPPFTTLHDQGVVGIFPNDAGRIFNIVEGINRNAMVA